VKRTAGWLFGLALAALVVACSGVSNSGGPGRGGTTGAGNNLASALPTPTPDPLGYDVTTVALNGVVDGAVSAIGSTPATALAVHTPLDEVAPMSAAGAGPAETTFPAAVRSLAPVGSRVFAGAGDPATTGAGDVFRRTGTAPGTFAWSTFVDSTASEATVAPLATSVAAALGGPGQSGSLVVLDPAAAAGQAAVVTSAALGARRPTAVVEYPAGSGDVLVGATDPSGDAVLLRVRGAAVEVRPLPLAAPAAGTTREITAIVRVPTTGTFELLLVALAVRDAAGAPLEGTIFLSDGVAFEGLHDLSGDAPTALAVHDGALVAGTARGRVLARDAQGAWSDLPGLPAVDAVTSLAAPGGADLLIGARTAAGARLVWRVGRSP